MKICVPSSNRVKTNTTSFLKDSIFFVPEGQGDDYKNEIDNEVIEVPNDFFGITKTRNYIINFFNNDDVLFLDDDVLECGYFKKGNRIDMKSSLFSEDWTHMFEKCFEITKEFGLNVWGAENGGSKFANHILNQIDLKGSVNGSILGVVNNSYAFNEKYIVKEDYDLVIRAYKNDGGFLKFNNFYWRTKHWGNKGGCVDYRTNKIEIRSINLLESEHNGFIKRGKNKNMFHTTLIFK